VFFTYYNHEHRGHGGLGLHTAADVHHGRAAAVRAGRALVLTYRAHPERFVRRPPTPPKLPVGSWINPPDDNPEEKLTASPPGAGAWYTSFIVP